MDLGACQVRAARFERKTRIVGAAKARVSLPGSRVKCRVHLVRRPYWQRLVGAVVDVLVVVLFVAVVTLTF